MTEETTSDMNLLTSDWAMLNKWVADILPGLIEQRFTNTTRWCTEWWRHPEAVARLWILCLSWTEVMQTGSSIDFSDWLLHHLDPHWDRVTRSDGPFAGCSPQRHTDDVQFNILPRPMQTVDDDGDSPGAEVVQLHT